MQRVLDWLIETALIAEGHDPTKATLEEFLATAQVSPVVRERVDALNALRNYRRMSAAQFTEVMTTAHFTHYFADALSRAFYKDYADFPQNWQKYTYAETAPDFRDIKRWRMSEPETLLLRGEKGPIRTTYLEEYELSYGVQEYARQFDVSWQAIQNDDLGEIRRTPQRMARAARLFEDSFVSALYDNATTQATLAALGAPWAGTGRLTLPNLAIGIAAMQSRTDLNGNPVFINRMYLVIPAILQVQAQTILRDLLQYGGAGSNILGSFIAGVYVDPFITTAAPNVPWYLFADPAEIPAVSVARLQGWSGPVVSMRRSDIQVIMGNAVQAFTMGDFATGDIEFMVETIIGGWDSAALVGVTDPTGLYYSSGTTP